MGRYKMSSLKAGRCLRWHQLNDKPDSLRGWAFRFPKIHDDHLISFPSLEGTCFLCRKGYSSETSCLEVGVDDLIFSYCERIGESRI
jgi:hypothetical protein